MLPLNLLVAPLLCLADPGGLWLLYFGMSLLHLAKDMIETGTKTSLMIDQQINTEAAGSNWVNGTVVGLHA